MSARSSEIGSEIVEPFGAGHRAHSFGIDVPEEKPPSLLSLMTRAYALRRRTPGAR